MKVNFLACAVLVAFTICPPISAQEEQLLDTFDEQTGATLESVQSDVAEYGWHGVLIPGEDRGGFVFTIGLWKTYKHPEIILFAPFDDPTGIAGWLSALVKRIAAGETFTTGRDYEGVFGRHSGHFRKVDPLWFPCFLGTAGLFYGNFDFPVLQLFWPDKEGRFPWQGGFSPDLFPDQAILSEANAVLANVGSDMARWVAAEEDEDLIRTSVSELWVGVDPEQAAAVLEEWQWLAGTEGTFFRATLFGDIFLRGPDGSIYWLNTGSVIYEKVAENEEEWLDALLNDAGTFFHSSLLLQLRSIGYLPSPGSVYSWIQAPVVNGEEIADNIQILDAIVHLSNAGRFAYAIRDLPPGAPITEVHFTPVSVPEAEETTLFEVVINAEEQYSMWPAGREIPKGWQKVGKTGSKQECLDYIESVWTDMRPKSLRDKLDAKLKEEQSPAEP